MPKKKSYLTVTDQFCGAGGSSIGAEAAGVELRLALNHWDLAIETHNTNFPKADHDCTDISAVDPRRYATTDILITSPECTNHSVAKGKARRYYEKDLFGNILIDPSEERSRATMWDVPRFVEYHGYNIIVVENVVDAAKWRMWDAWLQAMQLIGYEHEVVYYNSMFAWPTPQSRDRMYVVFWKKGNKKPDLEFRPLSYCSGCEKNVEGIQTWKKKRWGRYGFQYFYRCPTCHREVKPYYYAAINAIDFSISGERIGDRKTPLKPKTLERIQYGLDIYGNQTLLINDRYADGIGTRVRHPSETFPTQTAENRLKLLTPPWVIDVAHTGGNGKYTNSSLDPLRTQTTAQTVALVGYLTKHYGGGANPKYMSSSLASPIGTITTAANQSIQIDPTQPVLVDPAFIAQLRKGEKAKGLSDPLMCVTAGGGHHALITTKAFLAYYYGNIQTNGMFEPEYTVTTKPRAMLIHGQGEPITVDDLYFRMLKAHEIGNAMAFPDTYVVLGTQGQKVRQYGNAVTPPIMKMLIERCVQTFN